MADYISDSLISAYYFNGETVPGDNTITEARNTALKSIVQKRINGIIGTSSDISSDPYGDLERIALDLYGKALRSEPLKVSKEDQSILIDRYGSIPFVVVDPTTGETITDFD